MKARTQSPNCLRCNLDSPIDVTPDRLPYLLGYATNAGVPGINDNDFHRPARRQLRGRYTPATMSLPLFRVHG